jgi:dihydroorotate dehydrogenase (fumarate)
MPDLTTTYLELTLSNPLVASASPLSKKLDTVKRLEEAGAAAIVVYSLFEEEITHESLELDHYLEFGTHTYAESLSYFPDFPAFQIGPERYLEHLHHLKESVSIPVIGSLNGVTSGGWVEYASKIEQAGADALELNIYYLPTSLEQTGVELEAAYLSLIRDVKAQVRIPVAVKLSPFFTSIPHMAREISRAGAAGLVLFNRFYQPDFDIERLEIVPRIELSTSHDLRLPLRWIAILFGRIRADLALTSGVHTAEDALKAVMAGANVAMVASSLLANGPDHVAGLLHDMRAWMDEHEYDSITQMRGSMSQLGVADPAAFERANYVKALSTFDAEATSRL